MDDAYSPAPLSYSYLQMVQIPKIDGTRTGWAVTPIDYAARDLVASFKAAKATYNALRAIPVRIL